MSAPVLSKLRLLADSQALLCVVLRAMPACLTRLYLGKLGGRNCFSVSSKVPEALWNVQAEYRWAVAS